jgi:hypothetical protein
MAPIVDIRRRRYNIPAMSDRVMDPARLLWLAVAGPLWLGALLAAGPSAAEPQEARGRVPGIDAACRADAGQRARSAMRLDSVEWLAGPAEARAARGDAAAMIRVEIAGRARSAGGWITLTANCTYAKDRPAAISLNVQPSALDLSGVVRLPQPPKQLEANAPTAPSSSLGSGSSEASPSVALKPSLTEVPFDPLTIGKRQDFLKDHLLGIKLQTPF